MNSSTVIESLALRLSERDGQTAKYRRLEGLVTEMINSGKLRPGTRLPPDKEFAKNLGVSLGTVQKALLSLKSSGLIMRAPRVGTIVAEHQVLANDVFEFRFRDPATRKLIVPQVLTISVDEENRDGPWRKHLQCDRIIRFRRLLRIENEPMVFSELFGDNRYLGDLKGLNAIDLHGYSLHRHLAVKFGLKTGRQENAVRIARFDESARQHLLVAETAVGLRLESRDYSTSNEPLLFQRIQLPKEHRPIEFTRTLQGNFTLEE